MHLRRKLLFQTESFLYKKCKNQTFTFISSKVLYVMMHLAYQMHQNLFSFVSLGNKISTSIKWSILPPDNKNTVEAMVDPLHTWLKDVFWNLLFGCIWKDCQKMSQSEVSYNLKIKKLINYITEKKTMLA